jgi:superfamily II DNA or RNA helicase
MKVFYDKDNEIFRITEATRVEYHQTKLFLTRKPKGYQFDMRYKNRLWNGEISLFKDGVFRQGLWKEVYNMCKENGWDFIIENKQDFPFNKTLKYEDIHDFCKEFFKNHRTLDGKIFFPYEHQIESAYKIIKNRYCLAEVATGGGKSFIFSIVAFYILKHINPNAKFLLIVPSISLVTQFYNEIVAYNKGLNNENENFIDIKISEVMSDKPRVDEGECNIFIGTYQSLEKRPKEFFEQFYSVTTDESHLSGNKAGTTGKEKGVNGLKQTTKILSYTVGKASMRYGMSGTFPTEDTLDYLTIVSWNGPKINNVGARELMNKGVISEVKIKSLLLNYDDSEFNDAISLIRKGNGKGAFDLERKYIQESEARLQFVFDNIVSKTKKNTLVLFNSIEYGQKMYNKFKEELPDMEIFYIDGSVKKKDRENIKQRLEETNGDTVKIVVASYGVFSTGISIKNLHVAVFMESFKSTSIVIQSIGRILRLHADKTCAIIFDIVDIFDDRTKSKNTLYRHYEERKKMYNDRDYPYEEKKINLRK